MITGLETIFYDKIQKKVNGQNDILNKIQLYKYNDNFR